MASLSISLSSQLLQRAEKDKVKEAFVESSLVVVCVGLYDGQMRKYPGCRNRVIITILCLIEA